MSGRTQWRWMMDCAMEQDLRWRFSDEEIALTPSRVAGVSAEEETSRVRAAARLIADAGVAIRVEPVAIGVSIKFLQRFFMLESVTSVHPLEVAPACLFLGCKCQEQAVRAQDVIQSTFKLRTRCAEFPEGEEIMVADPRFFDEKQALLKAERDILRVLNFDLEVRHPYKYLYDLVSSMHGNQSPSNNLISKQIMLVAHCILNDSFSGTDVHLRFDERDIAAVAYYFAAKCIPNCELSSGTYRDATGARHKAWHEFYTSDMDAVEKIGDAIISMYKQDQEKDQRQVPAG
ncbi:Cyclin-K [Porphyridium purpureum]|uniref:Cyclin-K n=1 Tax=Porphyridium purpureum TaxID=35688 RepID=A0A5J4Z1Y0_PORPP|nr:Cyclin-K [Porphyridium purpureum]|eukprot:POR2380..scf208_2